MSKVSLDEAIELLMKGYGCSRRVARRKLTKAIKDKKVVPEVTEMTLPPPLEPKEAAAAFNDDPSSVFLVLADLHVRHDLSEDEILGELQSGRLQAIVTEEMRLMKELGEPIPCGMIRVTAQSMIDWIGNPKTPPALVEKFSANMKRPLQ